MAGLKVSNLKKSFGDHEVLRGVSFDLESGKFLSLLGPSGCGKTTILRIICGLETADEGDILVDGNDVSKIRPEKRNIGLVFQNYALFPSMNVAKNVGYGLKMQKVPPKEIDERVSEALELVKLGGYEQRKVRQLSGGEQQRVALARAIANNPDMIIADEPTGNIDPQKSMEIMNLLVKINSVHKKTVLVVTHEKTLVDYFKKRVITISDGRVVGDHRGGMYG